MPLIFISFPRRALGSKACAISYSQQQALPTAAFGLGLRHIKTFGNAVPLAAMVLHFSEL